MTTWTQPPACWAWGACCSSWGSCQKPSSCAGSALGTGNAQLGAEHAETAATLRGERSVLLEEEQRVEIELLLEKGVYLSVLKLNVQSSQRRQA